MGLMAVAVGTATLIGRYATPDLSVELLWMIGLRRVPIGSAKRSGEYTSQFAVRAARRNRACRNRSLDITPRHCYSRSNPSTACIIRQSWVNKAAAMDIVAACSGFLYGLTLDSQIRTAPQRLGIGAEILN
jgi:3-oxoacyl-[acyl-carrier-protein] synthase III